MAKLTSQLSRRPRLTYGMVALVVILAMSALVPFKYNKIVGYEVAVAGVQPDLALDTGRIDELLNALGMHGAAVDVKDCDPTCTVTISQLKNKSDAKIVCQAFETIEGNRVTTKLVELKNPDETTVLSSVKVAFIGDKATFVTDEEAVHLVKACVASLNETHSGTFNVCLPADGGSGSFGFSADCDKVTMDSCLAAMNDCVHRFVIDKNGNVTADGETCDKCCIKVERVFSVTSNGDTVEEDVPAAKTTGELPEGFSLNQNYPNPFNPTTNISFVLPQAEEVRLDIFNVRGQRVARLLDQTMSAGEHTIEWNGTTDGGTQVASGIYFYRLSTGSYSDTRKMTLLK